MDDRMIEIKHEKLFVVIIFTYGITQREGHLETVVQVIASMGHKYNSQLFYVPQYPYHIVFEKCN